MMLAHLAVTLAYLGCLDQAQTRLREALSEARRLKHVHTLAFVLVVANWLEAIIDSPDLQRYAEELLALSTEYGFPFYLGRALAYRGWSLTLLGHASEGKAMLMQGLVALRDTGAVVNTPLILMWLAETHARLAQPVEGLHCLAEAAEIIAATGEQLNEAHLHRVRGDLLTAIGNRSAAEQNFQQAIAVAERQGAKLFQLQASIHLARLWRDQGNRAEARDLLGSIHGWFTEGFGSRPLKEAKALLDEIA